MRLFFICLILVLILDTLYTISKKMDRMIDNTEQINKPKNEA